MLNADHLRNSLKGQAAIVIQQEFALVIFGAFPVFDFRDYFLSVFTSFQVFPGVRVTVARIHANELTKTRIFHKHFRRFI